MAFLQNGLLGMGGMGGMSPQSPMQGLLGSGLYDPAKIKNAKMKRGLLEAGIAMLSQKPSQYPISFGQSLGEGLAGGLKGADQAEQDYMQQAQQAYAMEQQQLATKRQEDERTYQHGLDGINDQWRAKEQSHTQSQWAQADAQKKEVEAAIQTLPPDQQGWAKAYPDVFAKQYFEQKYNTSGGADQYFGTPLPVDLGGGKVGYGLPSKGGGFKMLDTPEGGAFLSPYDKALQKAQGGAEGEMVGKQNISAPQAITSGENALSFIDKVRNDPNKWWGTGKMSMLNGIPGTGAKDFQNKVQGLKSGAFLTAIENMRGLGSLSDAEGAAATAAVNRMDTSTSEEEFNDALAEYEMIVKQGLEKSRGYLARSKGQPIPQPKQGSGNLRQKYGLE